MLSHTQLSQIDKKGYTLIENFLNIKEANLWIDFFKQMGNEIKRDIIKEKQGKEKKYKEATITIDPYKGHRHLSRIQRVLVQTKQGKDFIDNDYEEPFNKNMFNDELDKLKKRKRKENRFQIPIKKSRSNLNLSNILINYMVHNAN